MNDIKENINDLKNRVKDLLTRGNVGKVYASTLESLISRIDVEDGFFPESVAGGGYGSVMFCRTTGGIVSFLVEIGEYNFAGKITEFAIESAIRMGRRRIPHIAHKPVVKENGEIHQEFSMDNQPDGALHVIKSYAELSLTGKLPKIFEDSYYEFIAEHLIDLLDMPYFFYEANCPREMYPHMFPSESLKLIFNCAFEHSRENRRWNVFDLLTQSFAGSALESMSLLAQRRQDLKRAKFFDERKILLLEGIDEFLTLNFDGKKIYSEMRIPDGAWGQLYKGLSWVNFSPVASQWEALKGDVLDNTISLTVEKLLRIAPHTNHIEYLCTEIGEDNSLNPAILGKFIGWDLVYCLEKNNWRRILSWLAFLDEVNKTELFAENFIPDENGWTYNDPGNGEQCSWLCWGIAKIIKHLQVNL